MGYESFLYILGLSVCIFLGLFVYFKNSKSKHHVLYTVISFFVAYWNFICFKMGTAHDHGFKMFWSKFDLSGFVLSLAFLGSFIFEFSKGKKTKKTRVILLVLFLPAIIFSIFDFYFSRIRDNFAFSLNGTIKIHDIRGFVELFCVGIWALTILFVSKIILYKRYKELHGFKDKRKVLFVLISLSSATLGYIVSLICDSPTVLVSLFTIYTILTGIIIVKYEQFILNPISAALSIISTMSDSLLILNTDKRLVGVNKAAIEMLGFSEKELISQDADFIFGERRVEILGVKEKVSSIIFKKETCTDVEILLNKKRGDIPVSLSSSQVRKKTGELLGVVCLCRDISERRAYKTKTKEYKRQMERLNRELVDRELMMIELKVMIRERYASKKKD
ncbi:PAS domain-containing protein [Candidatus Dojkabacteria bacterium]|nr:PAS domain-containing protein [Candidatus Dojkabacteria bacterium]